MDVYKLVNNLEAFIYEIFGLLIPGTFFAVLTVLLFAPHSLHLESMIKPSGFQWVLVVVMLYVLGILLNSGRRIECRIVSAGFQVLRKLSRRKRTEEQSDEKADPTAAYIDGNTFRTARAQVAAYFGMTENSLTSSETFNLCLTVAGPKSAPYRKFVALRDMMRGLGFVATIGGLIVLLRLVADPTMPVAIAVPISGLFGIHLAQASIATGRLFYVTLFVILIMVKWSITEREKRYQGIARRIIYPIALLVLKETSTPQAGKVARDER